jgi:hypothetical protein
MGDEDEDASFHLCRKEEANWIFTMKGTNIL